MDSQDDKTDRYAIDLRGRIRALAFALIAHAFFIGFFSTIPNAVYACDLCVSEQIKVKTYQLRGRSLNQLRKEMRKQGPKGFWAYTTTAWKWDRHCNMRFSAEITMPTLNDRAQLSQKDLRVWDAMIKALHAHELEHVAIGRAWANEIKQANCNKAAVKRINAKYDNADEELDARTNHGVRTGVTLRRLD